MSKPFILVTNDDGINAPGLRFLINIMRKIGNVVVVAPDRPMSAQGHSITVSMPLRLHKIKEEPNYKEYSCNGTPVDCVKIAEKIILKRNPDLLVSGINHGSNASINVIYSGTMGAVVEGAIEGIPSIGFSLKNHDIDANFSATEKYIKEIIFNVIKNGLPSGVCLNVNFPDIKEENIKGIKICRQAKAFWDEDFIAKKDPNHNSYYWLSGELRITDKGEDTDEWALHNNYVSVVPVQFDLTAYKALEYIKNWKFDLQKDKIKYSQSVN